MPQRQRHHAVVATLLERHGTPYSDELGIGLARNTPSPLFRWLTASLLFSARIGAPQAVRACRALTNAGLVTPQKMRDSTWRERVDILNRHGYARYDESTARMLGDTADRVLDDYGGDLRRLRTRADGDRKHVLGRLQAFKGIGAVGAGIFLREVQTTWDEYFPFADDKSLKTARALDLGEDAEALAELVPRERFPALLTALVRAALAKDLDAIRKGAG